jgi:hypothetical protein
MRIKIFDGLTHGGSDEEAKGRLENEINEWLATNPDVEIMDIRLSMTNYPAHEYSRSVFRFPTVCLILYKEK